MKSPRATPQRSAARALLRVEVLEVLDAHTVLVRAGASPAEAIVKADVAVPGYLPEPGDRVIVERDDEGLLVLGVLGEARLRQHLAGLVATPLPDGGVELGARAGDLTLAAPGRVTLRASEVVAVAGRIEIEAERLVEHAVDTYRRAEGLAEQQAGRARTLVEGACQIVAGRTSITSEGDTIVDGARVLLG
ncbi:MAG: DUF3540 domain-containing protein [Byssovorax sp.]